MLATLLIATFAFDLPLTPAAEPTARALVAPYAVGDGIGGEAWVLWEIALEPNAIVYGVAPPGGPTAARVRVELSAVAPPRVLPSAPDARGPPEATAEALAAADAVARAVRANLGGVRARAVAPAASMDAEAPGPTAAETWLARGLLTLLLVGLAWLRLSGRGASGPRLDAEVRRARLAAGVLAAAWASVAFAATDVIVYQSGLGLEVIRTIAGADGSPFGAANPTGAMAVEVARLLGLGAARGGEAFVASRLAGAASIILVFELALTLAGSWRAALVAAAALALHPALLLLGRSEAATAPGLMILLLAAWLAARAGRRRRLDDVAVAAVALATLASYRLVGPVVAAPVGLLALALPPGQGAQRKGAGWLVALVIAGGLAIAASSPQLVRVLGTGAGYLAGREDGGALTLAIFASPVWSPWALTLLAAVGLLVALGRRPIAGVALLLAVAAVAIGTRASVGWWANVPRYHGWLLGPAAVALAFALAEFERAGPRVGRLGLGVAVAALAFGALRLAPNNTVEHPEAAQLRLWRAAQAALPPDAVLVVPVQSLGAAHASLGDAELLAARPDVRLMAYDTWVATRGADGPAAFWFEPTYCHARFVEEPPDEVSDCRRAAAELRLVPLVTEAVPTRAPAALVRLGLDPNAWAVVPFEADTAPLGLSRVASLVPGGPAPAATPAAVAPKGHNTP